MSRAYDIPESWIKASIEDIILYQKGKKPKKLEPTEFENSVPYLDIKAFEKKEIRQYADKESSQIIDEQDVIMVWDGARSGWVSKGANGALGSTIARFRPFVFSQKYLYYFLGSQFLYINSNTKGTGIPHVDPQILWGIEMPVPPLNEQHRIVSKIEELFSELDHGVANLKLAQNQLKVYRQALLKYAFEGQLTEQWRKENNPEPAGNLLERIQQERQNRYEQELKDWKAAVKVWEKEGKIGKKPGKPRVNVEIDFSTRDNNIWLKIEDTSTHIVDCLHSTPKFQKAGKYCVDTTCIIDGKILWDKIRFVSEESFKERISRLKPKKGDIFFAREGTVGTTLVLDNDVDICLGQRMMMFRPYSYILSKYFMYYFQSMEFKKQYKPLIGGTTAPHLNIGVIKKLFFPVCSIEEQKKIVDELEDRISIIDNLEQAIESGLQKSEALRQSILKKAFEGKLVPQDPKDEPASELLKRIQAEKKKYLAEQQQQQKRKPKNIRKMNEELSIEEVLKTSDRPMLAKDVWQKSKHKDNIEEFYKELKDIQSKIKEVKKGTESLLSLVK